MEMKVIRYIAAVSLFALLASCQMNTAGDGNQNENPSSESTTEYTVYFDLNYPEDTDVYMFCDVTVNVPPASITVKSVQKITLPACSTEMTRYPRNRYGEDGVGYEFDKCCFKNSPLCFVYRWRYFCF